MLSKHAAFWNFNTYAVWGDSSRRNFPELTFKGLKASGKTVYPLDSGLETVDGERVFRSLGDLPQPVEAVVLELPREQTAAAVRAAHQAGIRNIWIHQQTDTPEALEAARQAGLNVHHGTCAVMYLHNRGIHKFHGWVNKLLKKY